LVQTLLDGSVHFEDLTVKQARCILDAVGLNYSSRLRKVDLVQLMINNQEVSKVDKFRPRCVRPHINVQCTMI
jgi:hypothetical protein